MLHIPILTDHLIALYGAPLADGSEGVEKGPNEFNHSVKQMARNFNKQDFQVF